MAPQTRNGFWRRNNTDGQEDDLISDATACHDGQPDHQIERQNDADISSSSSSQQNSNPAKPVYTSQVATLFIIINVTIGAGLLAMPFAMQTAGIITSMIFQLIFLSLIVITCIMCIELTVKGEVRSYHEIVQKYCHPFLYQLTQVSIFLITFGVAVAFIVTIGDQSDRVFNSTHGNDFCHTWYMNRRFIMAFVTLVIIKPLCSARTVDFLKYASFLGLIAIGFICSVVTSNFVSATEISSTVNYKPKFWSDIAFILPVYCLAYQCHLSLVPTVATIRKQDKPKAFITSSIAMVVSMIIYSAISIMAVLTYGATIQKDLTESFDGKGAATLATIAIVGLKCALTLPAAYLPARLSLVDILTNNWARFAAFSEPVKRIGVTLVFLDVSLVLAIYVPDILVVVNLLGCLAVMFIFPIPGLAYISLVRQNRREKQQAKGLGAEEALKFTARDKMKLGASYFMIVFGVLMTGVVLYKSVDEMLANNSPSPSLCTP